MIVETVPGCDDRVVTIYSSSDKTNEVDGLEERVCPAQDALFRVHEKLVMKDAASNDDREEAGHVTVKLLVLSDQIGYIIGKNGQIVRTIRSETGARIRTIGNDDHLCACALSSDQLVLIAGERPIVRKALYQIASRLHDNPSRSHHMLSSDSPDSLRCESRDTKRHDRRDSYSGGYVSSSDLPPIEGYGGYSNLHESAHWTLDNPLCIDGKTGLFRRRLEFYRVIGRTTSDLYELKSKGYIVIGYIDMHNSFVYSYGCHPIWKDLFTG